MKRILVIGGTGAFGERLVEGLLARTDAAVTIGARDAARAEVLARRLRLAFPARTIDSVAVDTQAVDAARLRALDLLCVIDAAGPFQGASPRVARAAIAAGCHYVDLADARDFVAAFPALDADAKAAGVVALTGASSTPALSHAALDALTAGWQSIDSIGVFISPGNRAPRGLSVVQAILGGAGKPARVFRDGRWASAPGWGLLARRRLPGLGRRWFSLVETPDLDLLVERYRPRRSAVFKAGLELSVMHLGLWLASQAVRCGLLRSLRSFAPGFRWIADGLFGFGSDRGGMTVEAAGRDARGVDVTASWSLIAAAGDGPNVPTLPALAVVRALLAGRSPTPGARACAGDLRLADIAAEFGPFRIATRRQVRPRLLYRRVLGEAFDRLPPPIRAGHSVDGRLVLAGRASIEGADNAVGRLVARIIGFPPAVADVPVTVEMRQDGEAEIWSRTFGSHRFQSRLGESRPGNRRVIEQFGPIRIVLTLTGGADGITMRTGRAYVGPLRLPGWLTPRSCAIESTDSEGRFTFDVPIAIPLVGRLVRYRGWLTIRQ